MQSAHLYHYKMQKERLVAVESSGAGAGAGAGAGGAGAGAVNRGGRFGGQQTDGGSTADSEVEDGSQRVARGGVTEGDTVYEYPGLASGANMEIVNPVYRGPQPSPLASQSLGGQTASGQFGGGPPAQTAPSRPP